MKKRGLALVVAGGFLLGLGVLSKVYVYERVAVAPAAPEIDVVAATAPGDPATYFDIGQLKEVQAPLENRTHIRGNSELSEKASKDLGEDVVVWDAYACTGVQGENCLENPLPLAANRDVVAMTPHPSKVVAWDGAFAETGGERGDSAVRGWVYKLPFNVQKRDYTYWNGALGKQVTINFDGESKVKGLKVYKFSQTIEPTKVGTIDLPGSLVGSDEASVTGDRIASSTTTWDFEPETGVAMTTTSSPNNYVEVDGEKVLTTTRGTLSINDETVTKNVDDYSSLSRLLYLVRVIVPIVGVALGIVLIVAGGVVNSRRRVAARA